MLSFFELLEAIVFGVVEGITEWLPISSTGHMILLNEIMPLSVSAEFYRMFEVVIQLGAIFAVVVLYWHKIWPIGRASAEHGGGLYIKHKTINLWVKILLACIPAAVIGLLFDDVFEALFYKPIPVAIALIVFGVAFIVIENANHRKKPRIRSLSAMDYGTVLMIGVFQILAAVFPGTSRSGATIVGALLLGVSRKVAAEFTFFLAIPVMFGASLLKLVKFGFSFTASELTLLLAGMIVAFIVSLLVIKFLMNYIKKHDFKVFGWYRIVLGIIVLAFFLIRG